MASTDVVKTEVNEKDSAGESVEQQAKETALGPVSGGQLPPDINSGDATPPGPHMKSGLFVFFKDIRHIFKLDELGLEIADIAIPAALALAADPLASLVDTAFIGRIGPVQLAAVGVSIAVFNQVSKVAIYPLVSVTTSFVAEESASCKVSHREQEHEDVEKSSTLHAETEVIPHENKPGCCRSLLACGFQSNDNVVKKRKYIPSVSSAIVVGLVLGILQTLLLIFAGKPILNIMGIKNDSPMMSPGQKYLTIRALGAPAVLLSLAMQGVFRGFKDTKTPLYATVAGDAANIILDPIFIFAFKWGVSGAALAHVLSQYLISLILLGRLLKVVNIVPPSLRDLKFGRFLKCGFLLLARVIAVTFCVTLAASMAARHGTIPMAAFQICLQLWLATSLLADGLAVAGQAILASAFAKGDLNKAVSAASRVLQLSIVLGVALTVILGVFMQFGSGVFTKDVDVVKLIHTVIPFVAGTQTINSLAFVFDGVNFGASDYIYSAYSMVSVAVISIICLYLLSTANGFVGIWTALTIYISLRALAGVWRMGAARGPWSFLRQ